MVRRFVHITHIVSSFNISVNPPCSISERLNTCKTKSMEIFFIFSLSASKSLEIQIIFHFPTRRESEQKKRNKHHENGDIRKNEKLLEK
jgi:hypothetical protein